MTAARRASIQAAAEAQWADGDAMRARPPLIYRISGDFVEFAGDDADTVAAVLGITRTRTGCGIPAHRVAEEFGILHSKVYKLMEVVR